MISTEPDRSRLLAHWCRAHQLTGPAAAPADCTVLGVGVRDNPVGGTAALAMRARTEPAGEAEDGLIRTYSVRSAVHLHRRADLPLLIAALRWQGPDEAARGNFGDLAVPDPAVAVAQVAAAMSEITSDGEARTKGELSGAVTARLDPALSPWCASCKAHHVNDGLFRQATLLPEPAGSFRLHPYSSALKDVDSTEVAERKFLVADPARRSQVWRAVRNPGVVPRGGEVIGTWRDRKSGSGRVVTLDLFAASGRTLLHEIERRLQQLLPGAGVETQRS